MSRFSNVLKGQKARKTVEFPAPIDAANPTARVLVDLIVLSGDEEAAALSAALTFARQHGADAPKQGDPHFDLGLMVHTLARACVDHDVPGSFSFFFADESDPLNFDKMAATILQHLDRERIVYLSQLQQVWQDECSPWGKADTEEQILAKLIQLEGVLDPAVPFSMFRPATLSSLLLSMVKRLAILQADRSEPGGSFGTAGSSGTTPSTIASKPS